LVAVSDCFRLFACCKHGWWQQCHGFFKSFRGRGGVSADWEAAGLEATAFAEKELKSALEVRTHYNCGVTKNVVVKCYVWVLLDWVVAALSWLLQNR
jgi:hypothetical protein